MLQHVFLIERVMVQINDDLDKMARRYVIDEEMRRLERSALRAFYRKILVSLGNWLISLGDRLQDKSENPCCTKEYAYSK